MAKIPIDFSNIYLKELEELGELMGIAGVYGETPKAVKYGIRLAISAAKNPEKVYTSLEEPELSIYFETIKRAEIKRRLLQKAENLQKEAKKV